MVLYHADAALQSETQRALPVHLVLEELDSLSGPAEPNGGLMAPHQTSSTDSCTEGRWSNRYVKQTLPKCGQLILYGAGPM